MNSRKIITQLATVFILVMTTISFAQNKNERASVEVDGVCMMCKDRIEKAAIRTKGVKSALWDVDSHELQLIYDARKINLDSIRKNVAAVGHDTKELKATEAAYNTVHPCCRYRDEDVKKDHKNDN
ncbi:MAG: heavy-metal-associated domain-containing protein [Psychroserpens sp.]|uniref:heavy-metal-associated domain-containing protein n=1 Tax=Psychroserpens sp. TaxID=2020870 RepID=UPI003C9A3102